MSEDKDVAVEAVEIIVKEEATQPEKKRGLLGTVLGWLSGGLI